jgi:uncharacterized protein YbjT (DUF2867 family)
VPAPLKLLVLGASGGVGQWLVRLAAERGHDVTALARPAATLDPPPSVNVIHGDVLDPSVLGAALAGQHAVASCVGLRRAGASPWAPLRSPANLVELVMRALVPAMERGGVGRLVAVSAAGVGDSIAQLTAPVRWLVTRGNIGVAYRDLERAEDVLRASALDWLAVRPVTLANGRPTGRPRPVARYTMRSRVRRGDVAAWMLGALDRREPFAERTVMLGTD